MDRQVILQSCAPGTIKAKNCWKTPSVGSRTSGPGCCSIGCHLLCQSKPMPAPSIPCFHPVLLQKHPCKAPLCSAMHPPALQQGCHHFVRSQRHLWLEIPLGRWRKPGQFTRQQEAKYIYLALNPDAWPPCSLLDIYKQWQAPSPVTPCDHPESQESQTCY